MGIDFLSRVYRGELDEMSADRLFRGTLDTPGVEDVYEELGFDKVEASLYLHGASFTEIAAMRYGDRNVKCAFCGAEVDTGTGRWRITSGKDGLWFAHESCFIPGSIDDDELQPSLGAFEICGDSKRKTLQIFFESDKTSGLASRGPAAQANLSRSVGCLPQPCFLVVGEVLSDVSESNPSSAMLVRSDVEEISECSMFGSVELFPGVSRRYAVVLLDPSNTFELSRFAIDRRTGFVLSGQRELAEIASLVRSWVDSDEDSPFAFEFDKVVQDVSESRDLISVRYSLAIDDWQECMVVTGGGETLSKERRRCLRAISEDDEHS